MAIPPGSRVLPRLKVRPCRCCKVALVRIWNCRSTRVLGADKPKCRPRFHHTLVDTLTTRVMLLPTDTIDPRMFRTQTARMVSPSTANIRTVD
jgi:hypothetical protein